MWCLISRCCDLHHYFSKLLHKVSWWWQERLEHILRLGYVNWIGLWPLISNGVAHLSGEVRKYEHALLLFQLEYGVCKWADLNSSKPLLRWMAYLGCETNIGMGKAWPSHSSWQIPGTTDTNSIQNPTTLLKDGREPPTIFTPFRPVLAQQCSLTAWKASMSNWFVWTWTNSHSRSSSMYCS